MNTNFEIQNGKLLRGVVVNDHKFQGVTTLAQITDYGLSRPSFVEKAKKKSSDKKLIDAKEMHDNVQRRFDKARINRAKTYRAYIENVEVNGHIGGTPAITLWNPNILEVHKEGIIIPYGAILVAIDGETQTEARYLMAEDLPKTANTPFAITLYHGISFDHAQQILHDYNVNSHPVNPKLAATMNHQGPLSLAVDEVLSRSGAKDDEISRHGQKATKKKPVVYSQLLYFFLGHQMNSQALNKSCAQHIKKLNSPTSPKVPGAAIEAAVQYVTEVLTKFHDEVNMEDNIHAICPPFMWQVAGAIVASGHVPTENQWKEALVYRKASQANKTPLREQYKSIAKILQK